MSKWKSNIYRDIASIQSGTTKAASVPFSGDFETSPSHFISSKVLTESSEYFSLHIPSLHKVDCTSMQFSWNLIKAALKRRKLFNCWWNGRLLGWSELGINYKGYKSSIRIFWYLHFSQQGSKSALQCSQIRQRNVLMIKLENNFLRCLFESGNLR